MASVLRSLALLRDGIGATQRRSRNNVERAIVNVSRGCPSALNGTTVYVYGLRAMMFEQINTSTGTVTYLHHDQAGSTRLLTGSTGTVTGKCSYAAYGTPTCEGTATTPLGYDGQYTSSDTGLVYMRARVYDPSTAQFLSVDPLKAVSGEPYSYAGDNPLNYSDPTLGCCSGSNSPPPKKPPKQSPAGETNSPSARPNGHAKNSATKTSTHAQPPTKPADTPASQPPRSYLARTRPLAPMRASEPRSPIRLNHTLKPLFSSNRMRAAKKAKPNLHRKRSAAEVLEAIVRLALSQGRVDLST